MKKLYLFTTEKTNGATPYTLSGYIEEENTFKKGNAQDSVEGEILELDEAALKQMDKLYNLSYIRREVVEEDDTKIIYAYEKNFKYTSYTKPTDVIQNNLDMYLMIPCDLTNYTQKTAENKLGEYLIGQVAQNNNSEFKSQFIKCLERNVIGTHEIQIKTKTKEYTETGIFIVTNHPKTKNGIVTIFLPFVANNPAMIIAYFTSNLIKVKTSSGEYISIESFLNSMNIALSGTQKSLVFSEQKLTKQEVVNILACEYKPQGEIVGARLNEMATTNIAQYNTAEAYCGETVLLELQGNLAQDYRARYANEAIEVFFMELLLLQEAAISRICDKIVHELEIERNNPIRENNIQVLDELSCEAAQAILFLDFNCFIFPTVRNASQVIAENFGLNKLMEKYHQYKESLEILVNIHMNRVDEMENNNMNILLLVLTLTQVIPVFAQLFQDVMAKTFGMHTFLSFISSIGVCFILLLVFNILRRTQLRKYKNDITRRRKKQ